MKTRMAMLALGICLMLALPGSQAGQGAVNIPTTNTYLPLILKNSPSLLDSIAFLGWTESNTQDIFTMKADGSQLHNLTSDPARMSSVTWSPDGAKIAFVSNWEGNNEIYTFNADGSNLSRLTFDPGSDSSPTWSPDGSHIAFSSNRSGTTQVYVMESDGNEVTLLTNLTSGCQYPRWSPAGDKIACTSEGAAYNDAEIYTLNPDGNNLTNLTVNAYYDRMLEWSPDGSQILFKSNRDHDGEPLDLDLYVMNQNGSDVIRLTQGGSDKFASWSPEGDRIVYSDWAIDHEGTFIINVDGSEDTPLLCEAQVLQTYDPAWSPDGLQIAFSPSTWVTDPDGTTGGIYTVNIDGSECIQQVEMVASNPIWAPGD